MNTQNYTTEDIITALSNNVRRAIKMAYENYEIGSKPFVQIINGTEDTIKLIDALKAKGGSEEETLNRPNNFLAKTKITQEKLYDI